MAQIERTRRGPDSPRARHRRDARAGDCCEGARPGRRPRRPAGVHGPAWRV